MKKLILFGPPGAGKGTFSGQIKKILPDIEHISTGDIFRENLKNNTPLGVKAKEYMDKGELVPDSLTNEIVKDRLDKIKDKSWMLDGYPRNMGQVEFLETIAEIDLLLLLEVSRDIIKKRILGRYGCKNCGEIYNRYTLPPKVEGKCDKCGAEIKFEQRSDDNEETLKSRLDTYEKNAKPIIKYYKKKGKLKKVDAKDTLKYTEDDIKRILEI
ncbi:MAG: adenylate kinase family protein [Promethearchaeota archaeon]